MKKQWICLLLAAALLCGLAGGVWAEAAEETAAPATAEIGRLKIPEWTDDLWPALRPIANEQEAVAYVREILSSPLFEADLTNAEFTTEWIDFEEASEHYVQYRSGIRVQGTLADGRTLSVSMYADHGGVRVLFGPDEKEWSDAWSFAPFDPEDPWRQEMWQFALQLLEAMEPGVTGQFQSMRDSGDVLVDGVRFVQLQFIINDDYSKVFRLQVYPEIRLMEAYTGVG